MTAEAVHPPRGGRGGSRAHGSGRLKRDSKPLVDCVWARSSQLQSGRVSESAVRGTGGRLEASERRRGQRRLAEGGWRRCGLKCAWREQCAGACAAGGCWRVRRGECPPGIASYCLAGGEYGERSPERPRAARCHRLLRPHTHPHTQQARPAPVRSPIHSGLVSRRHLLSLGVPARIRAPSSTAASDIARPRARGLASARSPTRTRPHTRTRACTAGPRPLALSRAPVEVSTGLTVRGRLRRARGRRPALASTHRLTPASRSLQQLHSTARYEVCLARATGAQSAVTFADLRRH